MNHCYFLRFMWQFIILYDLFFFFCLWSLYLCFYLSLCLCRVSLFFTLTQSHYLISDPLPIYYALLAKNFPNFTIFFLSLVPIIVQLPVNKQLNIFSLSYLYNIRERVTNTEWQRVTKPKKKKNHRHRFNSQSPTSVHHYQ